MQSEPQETTSPGKRLFLLVAIAIVTIILWHIPYGAYILYPFSILGTWFHEMGHGLTALIVGGTFHKLEIYPNGSGIAFFALPAGMEIRQALVAAGGLLGPPVVGSLFLLSSKNNGTSKFSLILFEVCLILSIIIWVRSLIGVVMILVIAVGTFLILWKGSSKSIVFFVQLLGVQAAISTYRQLDYLFMGDAVIDGKQMLSDTGQIANQLLLPYWFWGGLIAVLSFGLFYYSLKFILKQQPEDTSEPM